MDAGGSGGAGTAAAGLKPGPLSARDFDAVRVHALRGGRREAGSTRCGFGDSMLGGPRGGGRCFVGSHHAGNLAGVLGVVQLLRRPCPALDAALLRVVHHAAIGGVEEVRRDVLRAGVAGDLRQCERPHRGCSR